MKIYWVICVFSNRKGFLLENIPFIKWSKRKIQCNFFLLWKTMDCHLHFHPTVTKFTRVQYGNKLLKKWKAVLCASLQPHGLEPTRLLCLWDSPGKNTGVGCHFLLQGIFPTQRLNPGLPHCRQTLYDLSHQGSQIFIFPQI